MNKVLYQPKCYRKEFKFVYDAIARLGRRLKRPVEWWEIVDESHCQKHWSVGWFLRELAKAKYIGCCDLKSGKKGWFIVNKTRKPFRKICNDNE